MSNTTNSFSSVLAQFTRLQTSSLEILQALSQSVSTSAETVTVTFKTATGETVTYNVPSYGYINAQIKRLDSTLTKLMGLDGTDANIRMPDGSYKKIYQSRLLKAPERITGLQTPGKFLYRNNWFFESMLSPALFVPFDVSVYVVPDADKILIKRVILNTQTDDQIEYFNNEFKGRNDITYEELIVKLQQEDIAFFVDEAVQDLPLSVLRYEGTFDVIRYEDVELTNPDQTVSKRRKYFLNKLTYTDNLANADDSIDLKINDQLAVGESVYRIESIDVDNQAITVRNVSGYDTISVGIDIFRIYSEAFSTKTAEVGVGFDERQVVFFKAVDPNFNIVSTVWSDGVGFYSNDLTVESSQGTLSLEQFYRSQVVDFGQMFLSAAKERMIPAVYGEIPNAPALDEANFKVVQVNEHKLSSTEVQDIQKKSADKVRLNSEINELDAAINKKKEELSTKKFNTEAERRGVKNELDSLIREKTSKSSLYASIVQELAVLAQNKPASLSAPKYRVRAFFEMPEPKDNAKTGPQYPIQFYIEYRYLRVDGSAVGTQQLEFTNAQGVTLRGSYSNWETIKSDIRKKVYNDATGTYTWASENIEDPDVVNINQIDVPISKGEKVEIRVRTVSEAGWPVNPMISDYSNSVIIEFPSELSSEDEASIAIANAAKEQTRVQFQQELDAKGLDLHLSRSTTTGDKYYAHDAEQIASGFFANDGVTILNLYEKIKAMEDTIKFLQAKVEQIKGNLVLSVVENDGTKNTVKNGDVIKLFAGYYEDYINALPPGERKGAIVTVTYRMLIENDEATPLELVSRLPGGIGERLPSTADVTGAASPVALTKFGTSGWVNDAISPVDKDYNAARRYDLVPIVNNSVDSGETNTGSKISSNFHQSQQLLSQFVYSRMTDIGLSPKASLYKEGYDVNGDTFERTSASYDPRSRSFVPVDPTFATGVPAAFVWNGTYTGTSPNAVPVGGGNVNGFAIHIDHPALNDGNGTSFTDLQNPAIILSGYIDDEIYGAVPTTSSDEAVAEFMISKYANLRLGGKYIGTVPAFTTTVTDNIARAQLAHRGNWYESGESGWTTILGVAADDNTLTYPISIGAGSSTPYNITNIDQYILPDKFGFTDRDRYLIGNQTCGAYLYLAPTTIDQMLTDGTDARAAKFINNGTGNGLEIPIVFQFRMTDYYGPGNQGTGIIGGYDPDATLQVTTKAKSVNLTYTKRIGLDIYIRNETPFSFDVEVTGKYRRESLSQKTDLIGKKVSSNREQISVKKDQIKDLR